MRVRGERGGECEGFIVDWIALPRRGFENERNQLRKIRRTNGQI